LKQAEHLLRLVESPLLHGKFYQLRGSALRGTTETAVKENISLLTETLNNYKKAVNCYRRAKHPKFVATCAINAGHVFLQLGQLRQAHYHLDAALTYYTKVGEKGYEASARDSKALVYLAEGNLTKAEREAIASVRLRQAGAEWSMLAESLRTLARVFIRRGLVAKAQQALSDAHTAAMSAGDNVGAGVSLLQWLEELFEHTPLPQARELYRSTVELLAASGNVALHRRLHEVSLQFVPVREEAESETTEAPIDWDNFSLYPALREVEANYLKTALRAAQGRVGRAAQLLGVTHQALSFALQHRFPEIAAQEKKPRRPRTVRPKAAPLAA
jgi:tetratricopeptide (TPR) repeat protein